VGIAPVKPAEFIIFRIGQWSGGPKSRPPLSAAAQAREESFHA